MDDTYEIFLIRQLRETWLDFLLCRTSTSRKFINLNVNQSDDYSNPMGGENWSTWLFEMNGNVIAYISSRTL